MVRQALRRSSFQAEKATAYMEHKAGLISKKFDTLNGSSTEALPVPEYKEDSIQTTVSKDIDRDCCIRLGRDWRLHQVVLYKKILRQQF